MNDEINNFNKQLISYESKLANELDILGILSKKNFKVPTSAKKETAVCDFYINSPTRAIIEIKLINQETSKNKKNKIGRHAYNQIRKTLSLFNPPPIAIFITNHPNPVDILQSLDESTKIHTININSLEDKSAHNCAKEIKNILTKHSSLDSQSFRSKPFSDGDFSDTYISLGQIMSFSNYKRIVAEITSLEDEIASKHFTSAALRVGRTLEFLIYVCAQSWGVKVNNRTNAAIRSLETSFKMFQSDYVQYSYSEEEEKEETRKKLQKSIKSLASKIQDIGFDLDKKPTLEKLNSPINMQTLIRDIKKKYSQSSSIRKEIDHILNDGDLEMLIQIRNNAAHAKSSLDNHEVTREEIAQMKKGLRIVIFRLVNIEYLIKKNHPRSPNDPNIIKS